MIHLFDQEQSAPAPKEHATAVADLEELMNNGKIMSTTVAVLEDSLSASRPTPTRDGISSLLCPEDCILINARCSCSFPSVL